MRVHVNFSWFWRNGAAWETNRHKSFVVNVHCHYRCNCTRNKESTALYGKIWQALPFVCEKGGEAFWLSTSFISRAPCPIQSYGVCLNSKIHSPFGRVHCRQFFSLRNIWFHSFFSVSSASRVCVRFIHHLPSTWSPEVPSTLLNMSFQSRQNSWTKRPLVCITIFPQNRN